jgi:myo-inositol-1(or 4)-monophosphatase
MNAWDCLAGQLLVAEAGGGFEIQSADTMTTQGGRVVVGAPGVFEVLIAISEQAYAL